MRKGALLLLLAACASRPSPPAATPTAGPTTAPVVPVRSAAWQVPANVVRPEAPKTFPEVSLDRWKRAPNPKASAACAGYAAPRAARSTSLASALSAATPEERDALLAGREPSEPELSRLVRADVAPPECGDSIVDSLLAQKSHAKNEVEHALVGFSLAGKLARTALSPPQPGPSRDKAKIKEFIQGPLKKWMLTEASAIEQLSVIGRDLVGYGRGVVAIEAGTAELRLVDNIRSSPTPKEWDPELRQVYEAALDEALEPRKTRGRDAALVGLGDLAAAGALHNARVDRARAILSKLYGGRRIDALDGLLVPYERPAPPVSTWMAVKAPPDDGARTRFEAGRIYWQRAFFVEAARGSEHGNRPEDRLILALSLALAKGPTSAAEMMRAPSPAALNLGHTEALDELVAEGGPMAGLAAFDAAHLRALSPPDGDASAHFRDLAARFQKAESLLQDPTQKQRAATRATEAAATAH